MFSQAPQFGITLIKDLNKNIMKKIKQFFVLAIAAILISAGLLFGQSQKKEDSGLERIDESTLVEVKVQAKVVELTADQIAEKERAHKAYIQQSQK